MDHSDRQQYKPGAGGAASGSVAVAAAPGQRDEAVAAHRAAVLADLYKLACRYREVDLSRHLDGQEELLVLGLGGIRALIPPGLRTDILFRHAYAGMLAIIRADNYRGAVVFTGTPGVGKTAAALVIACDLARRRRQFVHRSMVVSLGVVLVYMDFRDGQPRVDFAHERDSANFARLTEYLEDTTIPIIWDGEPPQAQYQGEGPYIVLAPPSEDNFRTFTKGGVPVYYMDTWSLQEILQALPLYPHITREVAVTRFRLFGGTVRDVLANAHVTGYTFQHKVEIAVNGSDLGQLCDLSLHGVRAILKHRLAHLRVGPDMLDAKLAMASPAIRWLAYRKNLDIKKRSVRVMVLTGAAGHFAHAGFRGHMLEEAGHEQLPKSLAVAIQPAKQATAKEAAAAARAAARKTVTSIDARVVTQADVEPGDCACPSTAAIAKLRRSKRLRAAASSTCTQQEDVAQVVAEMEEEMEDHHTLPPPEPLLTAAASSFAPQQDEGEQEVHLRAVPRVWDYPGLDLQGLPEYYLQPTTASNPGWDAVRKCPHHLWIIRYTVSEWHGTKAQPILNLLARLSPEDRRRAVMVYAVSPDVYPGYLQQPWLTVGNRVMVGVPEELARMRQMVLRMPLGGVDSGVGNQGARP